MVKAAGKLRDRDELDAARALLRARIAHDGPVPSLLHPLADATFDAGDPQLALDYLEQAAAADPDGPDTCAEEIRILRRYGFDYLALATAERAPKPTRKDRALRTALGDLYYWYGCFGHAVQSYGFRRSLPAVSRRRRLLALIACFVVLARPRIGWEKRLLERLRIPLNYTPRLEAVSGLHDGDLLTLRATLENFVNMQATVRTYEYAVRRWSGRLWPAYAIPLWLVIANGADVVLPGTRISPLDLAIEVLLAVAVAREVAVKLPSSRYWAKVTTARVLVVVLAVVIIESVVVEGYRHQVLPENGSWALDVQALGFVPLTVACAAGLGVALHQVAWLIERHVNRRHPTQALIDIFMSLLRDLCEPGIARAQYRLMFASWLNVAARWLQDDLLPVKSLRGVDPSSFTWLRKRSAGWAYAVRYEQRRYVAALPGSEKDIERFLEHEVRSLATGELGTLAWRRPPAVPKRERSWRKNASRALQIAFVALLPLAAVLAAQPLLHTSNEIFRSTGVASGAWALLYLLLTVDPQLSVKLETFRTTAAAARDAKPGDRSSTRT